MNLKYVYIVAIVFSAVIATRVQGQPPEAHLLHLVKYEVWCTDVVVPDGISDAIYDQHLGSAVGTIDKALGPGAATGTPFAARSRQQQTSGSSDENAAQSSTVVTVCTTVNSAQGPPADSQVYRENRSEILFAQACPMADSAGCLEILRTSLRERLGLPLEDGRVNNLFWRATSSVERPRDASALAAVLLATDKRLVHIAPASTFSGNLTLAAELSKPIEAQVARPLLQAQPSWFQVITQPKDEWLVVAFTLSSEMAQSLSSPLPEAGAGVP